jgi:glycopeptide antibiotics resistance protein
MYLLFQIAARKRISVLISRISGALLVFVFGLFVELMQYFGIPLFGSTYDLIDIFMYASGVVLGLLIDLMIINRFEKR